MNIVAVIRRSCAMRYKIYLSYQKRNAEGCKRDQHPVQSQMSLKDQAKGDPPENNLKTKNKKNEIRIYVHLMMLVIHT